MKEPKYLVTWTIDSDASTPAKAAQEAWKAMRRKCSIANCFEVKDNETGITQVIDLLDEIIKEIFK